MVDLFDDIATFFFSPEHSTKRGYKLFIIFLAVGSLLFGSIKSAAFFAAWLCIVICVELFFSDIAESWWFKLVQIILVIAMLLVVGVWLFQYLTSIT